MKKIVLLLGLLIPLSISAQYLGNGYSPAWNLGGNNGLHDLGSTDDKVRLISSAIPTMILDKGNVIVGNDNQTTIGSNNVSNLILNDNSGVSNILDDNRMNIFTSGDGLRDNIMCSVFGDVTNFVKNQNVVLTTSGTDYWENNTFIHANGIKHNNWRNNNQVIANGENIEARDLSRIEVFGTGTVSAQSDALILVEGGNITTKLSHTNGQASYVNAGGNQNFGVGTDNPQYTIDVNGGARIKGGLILQNNVNGILTTDANGVVTASNTTTLGLCKKFIATANLIAGNNTITHNLGLNTPFSVILEVRDATGSVISVNLVSENTNNIVISVASAISNVKIKIIG